MTFAYWLNSALPVVLNHAFSTSARIAAVAGAERDVPPHTIQGGLPPNELRAPSPDAHAPTVTTSGFDVPKVLGPRFDHGWTSPNVECAPASAAPIGYGSVPE